MKIGFVLNHSADAFVLYLNDKIAGVVDEEEMHEIVEKAEFALGQMYSKHADQRKVNVPPEIPAS